MIFIWLAIIKYRNDHEWIFSFGFYRNLERFFHLYVQDIDQFVYRISYLMQAQTRSIVLPVQGTNGRLMTGIGYRIKSMHNTVLDSCGGATGRGSAGLSYDGDLGNMDQVFQIVLTQSSLNFYLIRSKYDTVLSADDVFSTGQCKLSFKNKSEDILGCWSFIPFPKDPSKYSVVNFPNKFLDDWGGEVGQGILGLQQTTGEEWSSPNRLWEFVPVATAKAVMTNFQFQEDVGDVLNSHKKVSLIQKYFIRVTEKTVGSSVKRDFNKSLSNSFSWGLNQKIGMSVSMTVSAQIPIIGGGGISSTVTAEAEIGSHQDWSKQETTEISLKADMVPNAPGIFKMQGWVNVAENVDMPFKAKATITAHDVKYNNEGKPIEGQQKSTEYIEAILKSSNNDNITILARHEKSIQVQMTGVMRGTFGITAFTNFDQADPSQYDQSQIEDP